MLIQLNLMDVVASLGGKSGTARPASKCLPTDFIHARGLTWEASAFPAVTCSTSIHLPLTESQHECTIPPLTGSFGKGSR
jgi:hypothetical protein